MTDRIVPKVLIIGYVWPEPNSSAAGLRDYNLLNTFLQAGWEVIYGSSARENQASEDLRRRGIRLVATLPNDPQFDSFISEERPDFVIFDRFVIEEQFGWRVQEHSPETIRVLDTQDLHFLRRSRHQALKDGHSLDAIQKCQFDLHTDDTWRELGAIYRSDCSLVLSSFEMDLLVKQFNIPSELLFLSRFHYSAPPQSPSFSERKNLAMIGNFRHPPNADGVLWFRREIWPLIHQGFPSLEIHIYGAYPSQEMMSLTDRSQGFHVKGWASDPYKVLEKYRLSVAPLRFGAGIKGKITDSWWSGTPVLATPIGREGMDENFPWGGALFSDPQSFLEHLDALYHQETEWKKAQERGYFLLETLYHQKKNAEGLIQHLLSIKERSALLRKTNIIGSILSFHTFRSTKYFSKWIELKNQKDSGLSSS